MRKLALLALLLAGCGSRPLPHQGGGGDGPPPPPPGCPEHEPNDTIEGSTFISVFTPPDHITFCGELDSSQDEDIYHFFTPQSEIVSLVITGDGTVPIEIFLFANDLKNEELNTLGHWIGDPGKLVLLNFPVVVNDDGFHLLVRTPIHVPTDYQIEIWTPGFVY